MRGTMKLYDISLPLRDDLPSWPGDPRPQIERIRSISQGSTSNLTQMTITVHTGTHIDAPDHFLDNGQGVDQIPLDLLIGSAAVVQLPPGQAITAEMLKAANLPTRIRRLLFKTPNSQFWAQGLESFQTDFMALTANAAEYLVQKDIEVIGVDYLSVAPYADPVPTHKILLEEQVLIIEGLDLSGVDPGQYTLYCLPLKIPGAEGAPARVLLGREDVRAR